MIFPEIEPDIGFRMHRWASDLFPINRSITGSGVRETLDYLTELLPGLKTYAVSSGTEVFDWTVPDEWNIREAYIEDEQGNRVVDFKEHNLHVVGYSESVDQWLTLEELQSYLYSLPDQPDAIPYVTSYYERRWGFCLTHEQRNNLQAGSYHVVIDSDLQPGVLNYGELILPGDTEKEVFLSTYICHPSMANNELSGPVVTAALAQFLMKLKKRRYTYRVIFIPETIGAIAYLNKNLEHMKEYVFAGFNISCVGDDRAYSYLPSRAGNTLSDQVALHVLKYMFPGFVRYTYLDRGSDERQYCSPGVDLPIASIMRTKYAAYPEYHTSLDDLTVVTPSGLRGGFVAVLKAIELIENNITVRTKVFCEPQFGKRGLRSTLGARRLTTSSERMMSNLVVYADGNKSILEISEIINVPCMELIEIAQMLIKCDVLEVL